MKKEFKTFMVATITIFILMVLTYVMSLCIDSAYIPFYKWVLSPILVLGSNSGSTTIAVIIFLLVIGGISNCLNSCGFMEYMINKIASKYSDKKYKLMFVMVFFFMALGSLIGSFEEVVPIVPIVVALAIKLGFDAKMGMSMSLLAVSCGFAAGIFNPFTIGVAQELAGLPMFSGALFRTFGFVLIYILLVTFLYLYGRRLDEKKEVVKIEYTYDAKKDKALKAFVIIMGIGLAIVLTSPFITFLQDYTMIIIALMFLIGGLVASIITGHKGKELGHSFIEGVKEIAPSILLILMASSIKYTMEESGMINPILSFITGAAGNMNKVELILFIYFICLIMEIFVPSGSAKAFLLIPLIVPLANNFGINPQLCILAYAFGDGFSNALYPTNPALLISLGLIEMDYKEWFKYSIKFQLLNIVLTSLILVMGLYCYF